MTKRGGWNGNEADRMERQSPEIVDDDDDDEFADWDGPTCWRCGAPVVEIPGFAPGCINNCPSSPDSASAEQAK